MRTITPGCSFVSAGMISIEWTRPKWTLIYFIFFFIFGEGKGSGNTAYIRWEDGWMNISAVWDYERVTYTNRLTSFNWWNRQISCELSILAELASLAGRYLWSIQHTNHIVWVGFFVFFFSNTTPSRGSDYNVSTAQFCKVVCFTQLVICTCENTTELYHG